MVSMKEFFLRLAGVTLPCSVRYEDTIAYFKAFGDVPEEGGDHPAAPASGTDRRQPGASAEETVSRPTRPVHIPDRDWEEYLSQNMAACAHTEYSMLAPYFSDELLKHDRVVIHAAAVRWNDRAYLICAASGTGKSTQASMLQSLHPGEFSVICGDRPILQFHEKEIWVHPSPWNGKENWYGAEAAPLAGLVLLERGEQNSICALSNRDAALPFYMQFIQTYWRIENICKIAELETRLLQAVPAWKLTTYQVPDSTKLLLETIFV